MKIDLREIDSSKYRLSPNDSGFFKRVYADGLGRYQRQLQYISFVNKRDVLDAGCGFGQWSFAMAQTCRHVTGIDICRLRLSVCREPAKTNQIRNVSFLKAELENIPFSQASFDAIFCYSVVYLTDYVKVFREFYRVLKPQGIVYICTNGPGRYLYDIIHKPNAVSDFNPRLYGVKTFWNTIIGRRKGLSLQDGARIMTRRGTKWNLQSAGFKTVFLEGEGMLNPGRDRGVDALPFYDTKYMGLDNVFEVMAVKSRKG